MSNTDELTREEIIELLMFLTGRPRTYFESFGDARLNEEYDRLNQQKQKGGK